MYQEFCQIFRLMVGIPAPTGRNRQRIIQHRKKYEKEAAKRLLRINEVPAQMFTSVADDAVASSSGAAENFSTTLEVNILRQSAGLIVVECTKEGASYTGILLAENTVNGAPGIMREEMTKLRENLESYVDSSPTDQWTSMVGERLTTNGLQLRDRFFMRSFGRMVCAGCMAAVPEYEMIPRRHFTNSNLRRMLNKPRHNERIVAQLPVPDCKEEASDNNSKITNGKQHSAKEKSEVSNGKQHSTKKGPENSDGKQHLMKENSEGKSCSATSEAELLAKTADLKEGTNGQNGSSHATNECAELQKAPSGKARTSPKNSKKLKSERPKVDNRTKSNRNRLGMGKKAASSTYKIRTNGKSSLHMTFIRQSRLDKSNNQLSTASTSVNLPVSSTLSDAQGEKIAQQSDQQFQVHMSPDSTEVPEHRDAVSSSNTDVEMTIGSKETLLDKNISRRKVRKRNPPRFLSPYHVKNSSSKAQSMTTAPALSAHSVGTESNWITNAHGIDATCEYEALASSSSSSPTSSVYIVTSSDQAKDNVQSESNFKAPQEKPVKISLRPVRKRAASQRAMGSLEQFSSGHSKTSPQSRNVVNPRLSRQKLSAVDDQKSKKDVVNRNLRKLPVRIRRKMDPSSSDKSVQNSGTLSTKRKCTDLKLLDTVHLKKTESLPPEDNPLGLTLGTIVWAKNRTEAYWPGRLHAFIKERGVSGASITWFGAGTYSPFIELGKIELFAAKFHSRFNPRRAESGYHKAVALSILANFPEKGYFEQKLSPQVRKILEISNKFDLSSANVISKRRKKSAIHSLLPKKRKMHTSQRLFENVSVTDQNSENQDVSFIYSCDLGVPFVDPDDQVLVLDAEDQNLSIVDVNSDDRNPSTLDSTDSNKSNSHNMPPSNLSVNDQDVTFECPNSEDGNLPTACPILDDEDALVAFSNSATLSITDPSDAGVVIVNTTSDDGGDAVLNPSSDHEHIAIANRNPGAEDVAAEEADRLDQFVPCDSKNVDKPTIAESVEFIFDE